VKLPSDPVARTLGTVSKRRSRWARRLLVTGAVGVAATAGLWVAIHEVPGFGPALADGVRSVVGPGPVAWAEDVAYGAADWLNLHTKADAAPTTFWEAPQPGVEVPAVALPGQPDPMLNAPPGFAPPHEKVAAEGDGKWIPMKAPWDQGPIAMWKTLVHPDPKRPFAAVAVVAIHLADMELGLIPGTEEPKSQHVPRADRPGLIPAEKHEALVAAFNGGFKAMHGNYGMRIGERVFIPPRGIACDVGIDRKGILVIGTHDALEAVEPSLAWYRQTPPCLVENGEPNPGLLHEFNRNWGATVGGDTIIRRSAIGLSKDKKHLFYALGDAVTAQSIGRAMITVGAHDAAQLDVNHSYPRFLLFEKADGGAVATAPIIPDIKFNPSEYVRTPSQRDFFFLTRKQLKTAGPDNPVKTGG
jgi:hypothetical protein